MSKVHRMAEVFVSAKSTEPLIGIVQVKADEAEMRFEITEELAHKICTELERFLTRRPTKQGLPRWMTTERTET